MRANQVVNENILALREPHSLSPNTFIRVGIYQLWYSGGKLFARRLEKSTGDVDQDYGDCKIPLMQVKCFLKKEQSRFDRYIYQARSIASECDNVSLANRIHKRVSELRQLRDGYQRAEFLLNDLEDVLGNYSKGYDFDASEYDSPEGTKL